MQPKIREEKKGKMTQVPAQRAKNKAYAAVIRGKKGKRVYRWSGRVRFQMMVWIPRWRKKRNKNAPGQDGKWDGRDAVRLCTIVR